MSVKINYIALICSYEQKVPIYTDKWIHNDKLETLSKLKKLINQLHILCRVVMIDKTHYII